MADISKITLPNGTTYDIKDATARQQIADLSGFTKYLGVTTTTLTDGAKTNPITVDGSSVTAKNGDIVLFGNSEFIFNGTTWSEFGNLSALGSLAYKNSVAVTTKATGTVSKPTFTGSSSDVTISTAADTNGNYTPAGTVTQPTFTGNEMTVSGTFKPTGSVAFSNTNKTAAVSPASSGTNTYTPAGTNSGTAVELNTTTVNSITAVGSLPTFTVSGETLTLTQGTLPTKGSNTTVATSVKSVTQPTFTGTGVRLVTGNISVPSSASFTGNDGDIQLSGTPTGTVSKPTFSGTKVKISGTTTAKGSVSQPTFTGDTVSGTVSYS